MMVIVKPVLELFGRNTCILTTLGNVCIPFVQRLMHLQRVFQSFQFCGVIHIDGVFQKGIRIIWKDGKSPFVAASRLFTIQLVVIDQSFDVFSNGQSVLVISFRSIVVYFLSYFDGHIGLATEVIFLTQQHPRIVIVGPELVLATEVQHLRHLHDQAVVDVVVIVIRQHLILQLCLFGPFLVGFLKSVVFCCIISIITAASTASSYQCYQKEDDEVVGLLHITFFRLRAKLRISE